MPSLFERILGFHNWRYSVSKFKASTTKTDHPLRIGILSAAAINYIALIDPVQSHPDATITAIAARSLSKAQSQIATYNLQNVTAYGSYAELLANQDIDAVYIPLPNGLHAEWAIKAMKAGKHVLIEKPMASNAEEAKMILQTARETGKVALEAYHWRFYPVVHRIKELVDSGRYGAVESVDGNLTLPGGAIPPGDIRYNYSLAGGSCMDLAYVFSSTLYMSGAAEANPPAKIQVIEATPRIHQGESRIDEAMKTKFQVTPAGAGAKPVTCTTTGDLAIPKLFGFISPFWKTDQSLTIELEKAQIYLSNYVGPWLVHKVTITDKDTKKKTVEQLSVDGVQWGKRGQEWWTTYRYQLEAFVEKVRLVDRGEPQDAYKGPWVSLDESVRIMEVVDAVYDKAGMPRRGV